LGEGRVAIIQHAAQLLADQGRPAEALALLHRLPDQALGATPGLARLTAKVTLRNASMEKGDAAAARQRAVNFAHQAVPKDSKDCRDYLLLGQFCVQAEKPDDAEQAFRRARDLADTRLDTWAALILFLATKDAKKAEQELTAARAKLPADQQPMLLGPAYEAL